MFFWCFLKFRIGSFVFLRPTINSKNLLQWTKKSWLSAVSDKIFENRVFEIHIFRNFHFSKMLSPFLPVFMKFLKVQNRETVSFASMLNLLQYQRNDIYFQTITDTPIVWKSWSMTLSCKCCVTETDQRQPRSWTLRISWVSVLLWDSLDDTSPSPRAIIGSIQEQPGIVTCYNSSFMQMLCLNLLIFSQFLLQTSKTKDMK